MLCGSPTVSLVAGVCAIVAGFVAGGNAAPANTSAPNSSANITPARTEATTPPGKCTASPRNASPSQNSDETITVHTTRGADANLVVHYPTSTRSLTIVAGSAGTAVITFSISQSVARLIGLPNRCLVGRGPSRLLSC
jgi:hypothetical protein